MLQETEPLPTHSSSSDSMSSTEESPTTGTEEDTATPVGPSTSSRPPDGEVVEFDTKNIPPSVGRQLPRLPITAGKFISIFHPATLVMSDIFHRAIPDMSSIFHRAIPDMSSIFHRAIPDMSSIFHHAIPVMSSIFQYISPCYPGLNACPRYKIPESAFSDLEDGNTRNLRLIFKAPNGTSVSMDNWVQFNPESQEVYAL
uniref:Uncharacterized protein n=1 Tax=Timema shepardi TaxID=629360 RepID=A0A7R9G907_TIMSH|nr:unnamed protein product [Timema shepardi]